ncbi:MAG: response regulator transcription factor [Phycisphaerae bacterium]
MDRRSVLVIEDDPAIREGMVDALDFAGYRTIEAADGKAGLERALTCECELILLDLILPEIDGLEILRQVRLSRPTLPVICLTAKGEESDRITGLRLGADDYVVKPFSVRELMARIEAVLRRSPERPTDLKQFSFPGGQADLNRRELSFEDGQRNSLSERESELLRYLVVNAGRAVARGEILSRVWRISPNGVDTRTIDMHIARLREKLRDPSNCPQLLLTVRGKGYMWAVTQETA